VDSKISLLIGAAEQGDVAAANALFGALYAELHRLAKHELARPGAAVSLGATTLLHEAYLDMAARDASSFPDQARFMGYAARVMRGVIIDHARERHAQKREIVDLKFFCGFSFVEIAAMRDVSERTVQRNWEKARIYLHRKIRADLAL